MREWFKKEYWLALEYIGINKIEYPSDWIYNMNKKGYRIACPKDEDVIVPLGINKMYVGIPENRLSLTIIKSICTNGTTILLVVIILGGLIMELWFHKNIIDYELIIVSLTSYTNLEINLY